MLDKNEITPDYKLPVDEMTDAQIRKVTGVISRYFGGNVEDKFGLPYTSSSAFAGLWNTNCEYIVCGNQSVQGFTLAKDNRVIMLTHEADETEHWHTIGKLRG